MQLTPPGSSCSLIFGTGVTSAVPGSADGLQLVVTDIDAARAELAACGVDVSDVFHDAGGVFHHAGTIGRAPGPAPEHKSYGSFPRSAIPTATAGLSKRSPRVFRGGRRDRGCLCLLAWQRRASHKPSFLT